jgi:hypothetical protein
VWGVCSLTQLRQYDAGQVVGALCSVGGIDQGGSGSATGKHFRPAALIAAICAQGAELLLLN